MGSHKVLPRPCSYLPITSVIFTGVIMSEIFLAPNGWTDAVAKTGGQFPRKTTRAFRILGKTVPYPDAKLLHLLQTCTH